MPEGFLPLALHGGASAASDQTLYIYGGLDSKYNEQGNLYSFEVDSQKWTLLSTFKVYNSPMRKSGCGMVLFEEEKLVLFGGRCNVSGRVQLGANYAGGYTNEQHVFDVTESELGRLVLLLF